MEGILEFIMENAVSIITGIMVVFCYIFGKPKLAEKIKKVKEKKLEKTHKKTVKLVHALDESNKKEEKLKKEIEEYATR